MIPTLQEHLISSLVFTWIRDFYLIEVEDSQSVNWNLHFCWDVLFSTDPNFQFLITSCIFSFKYDRITIFNIDTNLRINEWKNRFFIAELKLNKTIHMVYDALLSLICLVDVVCFHTGYRTRVSSGKVIVLYSKV